MSHGLSVQSTKNAKGGLMGYHLYMTRHPMETFSALLAICVGNSAVTDEFPTQGPVTRSFDIFFDLNKRFKRLSKQLWGWGFETLSRPLWRHCNEAWMIYWHVAIQIKLGDYIRNLLWDTSTVKLNHGRVGTSDKISWIYMIYAGVNTYPSLKLSDILPNVLPPMVFLFASKFRKIVHHHQYVVRSSFSENAFETIN